MASLFGEVAKAGGEQLIEYGEGQREERLLDEEAQREMQLAKMRMQHDSSLTQQRIDADDKRESRRMEYETTAAEQQRKWDEEDAAADRESSWKETYYEGQVDLATSVLNRITAEEQRGIARGKGWTTFTEQGMDESGAFTTQFYATREGITYRQIGDKYVDAGDPSAVPYSFGGDIAKQREAEGALLAGEYTAQEFKDAYGYVPTRYVTSQVVQGNSDIQQRFREAGIDFERGASGGHEKPKITRLTGEIQSIVDQSATQYGVPKELIMSVMDVESGGESDRANATSTAGARGHMQLMPETAAELGVTDITDPGQNIPGGAAYLAQMMQRYGGDVTKALAAYNAGPTRVDSALQSGGDWISKLPPETRNYLPKALGRYFTLTQQGGETAEAPVEGGPLSEGAAAAEAEQVTQGGQMDQPAPAPAPVTPEQAQQATRGGELSDNDAADIARTIELMLQQRESVTTPQDEITDPLGAYKEIGDMIAKPFRRPETRRHPTMTPEQQREAAGIE
jgi:SLT domain-containing protein